MYTKRKRENMFWPQLCCMIGIIVSSRHNPRVSVCILFHLYHEEDNNYLNNSLYLKLFYGMLWIIPQRKVPHKNKEKKDDCLGLTNVFWASTYIQVSAIWIYLLVMWLSPKNKCEVNIICISWMKKLRLVS